MENLFKQAQNAGIALERKAASSEVNVSSYDTSPDTAFYQQSKLNKGIDLSGAFKGLEKLVEEEAQYQRDTEYVEGQLAAQTGKALDENASKWTTRGYKSFKRSAEINGFVGSTIGRMDEFAEQSPAAFQQYLKESFDEMSATEDDPYIKEQMAKMFTNTSDALVKQHTKSREEVNKVKTLNWARENMVANLYANGGKVTPDVIKSIEQTQKALPELEAYATVADAAYVAMIENGQTGLYKHLEEKGYFNKLDSNTRATLARTYDTITKAVQKAAEEAQNDIAMAEAVEKGTLGTNKSFTDKEKNAYVNAWLKEARKKYPRDEEGNRKFYTDIMEMSVKNNYYSHAAAKTLQNLVTNPISYVEGKPVLREGSTDAYVAIWATKEKLGKNGDKALDTFLDEDTQIFLEQVNDLTDYGIDTASPDQLRAAIMKVYDANNRKDPNKIPYSEYLKSPEYADGLKLLSGKIEDINGQDIFSKLWTGWETLYLDPSSPEYTAASYGLISKPEELRGLEGRNPEFIKDSYQRLLRSEYLHAPNAEVAAKRAALKVAKRTHNILGNFVMFNGVRTYETVADKKGKLVRVPRNVNNLAEYLGLDAESNDDDISEALGEALLASSDGKMRTVLRKHLKEADVSLNTERDTLTIKFNYDARNFKQRLAQGFSDIPILGKLASKYALDAEDAEFDDFYIELPIQDFRNYFVAKSKELENRLTDKKEQLYGK